MKFSSILILMSTLATSTSFASDAATANSLFKAFAQEVKQVLELEKIAENEIGAWYTSADNTNAAAYCRTGYYGRGTLKVGVPFKIGRNATCLKTYKKMGEELEGLTSLKSWEYLNRVYSLPDLADQTLSSIGVIAVKGVDQAACFRNLYRMTKVFTDLNSYYLDPMRDEQIRQSMNALSAMKFLKIVTRDGRKTSEYLVTDDANKEEVISRGREIHLAIKVLRMSLYNQATPDLSKLAADMLDRGCEF